MQMFEILVDPADGSELNLIEIESHKYADGYKNWFFVFK